MSEKRELTEEERSAKLREWDNTPSPNPRYERMTPGQAARRHDAATEAATAETPIIGVCKWTRFWA